MVQVLAKSMSYSHNFLKGGYIGDYIGTIVGTIILSGLLRGIRGV